MPVVLTFMSHYLPGHKAGGPVRTIGNMVETLGDEVEFRIVTSDRDLLDEVRYAGVSVNEWTKVGKAWVYYLDQGRLGFKMCWDLIEGTPHDVLYLNSFFSPRFSILPFFIASLFSRSEKLVLAPRGEFSSGALSLKSTKKKAYINFISVLGLVRKLRWQASSDEEAGMIRRVFPAARDVMVARDLPDYSMLSRGGPLYPEPSSAFRILFLSRISPMKNLEFAIRALEKCGARIDFDIWGTIEDLSYWEECKVSLSRLPGNIQVVYRGVAEYVNVPLIMGQYDLFFLPTLGENYGHAIAEAVSAGTPVLISDRTPWRDLESKGVGWDLPLENGEEAFVNAINAAISAKSSQGDSLRRRVYEFAVSFLQDSNVVKVNKDIFKTV